MSQDSGHLKGIAALFQTAVAARPEANVAPADLEGLSLEEASAELPEAFRTAFALDALSDTARELESNQETWGELDETVRRFIRGRRVAIAVTGIRGTGRRGYLQRIRSIAGEGEEVGLSRLRFESIRTEAPEFLKLTAQALSLESGQESELSVTSLADELCEGPRRVVIVERAHNLYMRKIGGFDALRAALALVAATLDRIMWVFEVDHYAWEYLKEISPLRDYFDLVVEAPLLGEADLKEVFTRQLEGLAEEFPTRFLAPKDLAEAQRAAWGEVGFYHRLHQASSGNLEAAGILFCRSTRWSEQLKKAVILPIPKIPFQEALASYHRTTLLALAVLVEHEELSQQDLSDLLLISANQAQSVLDTLLRHSVTSRRAGTDRYLVNTPWLAAIGVHLSNWNIL